MLADTTPLPESFSTTPSKSLTVEVWSDLICPWCWIGKRRFERALADFPERDSVRVLYHSFRLNPGAAPGPVEAMMARRFGPAVEMDAIFAPVEQAAAQEGLTYHLAGVQVGDTLDAHRLVHFARTKGLEGPTIERFYRAYFTERESLFDRETLLRLATEVGLERNAALTVLEGTAYTQDVEADQMRAQRLGANGVPFFLMDGRIAVSGAQKPGHFLQALTHAWDTAQPVAASEEAASPICGPDGCELPSA